MARRKQKTLEEVKQEQEIKETQETAGTAVAAAAIAPAWLKETFGVERVVYERRDLIGDDRLEGHEVIFEQDEPDVVRTRFGRRVMIDALVSGEPSRVVIGHVNFAIQVARLQAKYGSLKGVKIRVRRIDKSRKPYQFEIEDLGVADNA
ncbi:hypothetical protein J7L13_01870 [bacterium]|nr:hypothetical protein [bacterium]